MINKVEEFKTRLNQALEIKNITPADLSRKTKISESTISQYRSGYAKPKEKKLAIISNALNVNPAWLMGLDVSMNIERVDTFNSPEEFELAWHQRGGGRHPITLTDEEYELILEYRVSSEDDKKMIKRILSYATALKKGGD